MKSRILDTAQRLIADKGFSGVGINEILAGAGVPKGSYYHYFGSKEAMGSELLQYYFERYLAELDLMLDDKSVSVRERLENYWRFWRNNQEGEDLEGKCLAVKLGAEVSDISHAMRIELKTGTSAIIGRLSRAVKQGVADGSVKSAGEPQDVAEMLYQLWLGASIMTKIERGPAPFDAAMLATDQILSGR